MQRVTKGIILAGGKGTRLFPLTKVISKHLLPVYKKPLIFYPLETLIKAKINDILVISDSTNIKLLKKLLGNGLNNKVRINYKIQTYPNGISEAFIIGNKFIGKDHVCLILGDNIFNHTKELSKLIQSALINLKKNLCTIFTKPVSNPSSFGIAYFNKKKKIINIIEKPKKKKSNMAVVGMYFFTNDVIKKTKILKPSKRNELEITSLIKLYIDEGRVAVKNLKNIFWADCGTFDSLLNTSIKIKKLMNLNK
jgi:glucose-1-phosphate thymidylyltransferase